MAFFDEFDWDTTPLGPMEGWEASLRTTYDIMMANGFAVSVMWGPEKTFIYNEAYAPFLGKRHPAAFGRPMPEVWHDIWDDITPIVDRALEGKATYLDDFHLVMTRNDFEEDTYWRFSYSPLRDDDGKIVGFMNTTTDMTETVLLRQAMQRRTESLIESESRLLRLVTAGAYSIYRMSPDWTEMRQLEGMGIIEDTKQPSVRWLDVYIDEADRPQVLAAIKQATSSKTTFELEHRVKLPDGGFGWVFSRAVPIFDERGQVIEWFGAASDITPRKTVEEQQELRNHEIGHRLKNILAVVQSIAFQTIRAAADLPSAQKALSARLEALARSQNVLLSGEAETTNLQGIIATATGQHEEGSGRILVHGPAVQIDSAAALNLALTFHELATNAVKYGALREPDGKVDVSWKIDGTSLNLRWVESGGPVVTPPERKGFGSKLIERGLVAGGRAHVDFHPSGLVYTLSAPLSGLLVEEVAAA